MHDLEDQNKEDKESIMSIRRERDRLLALLEQTEARISELESASKREKTDNASLRKQVLRGVRYVTGTYTLTTPFQPLRCASFQVQELSAAHAHCATDKAAAEDAHARERTERDLAHSRERGALESQAAALEASVAELRDKAERLGAAVTKVRYPPYLGAPGESHVLSFCSSVRDVCVHQAREEKVAADAEVEKAGVTVSTQAATIADMEGREAAQARQIADLRRGLEGLEEQSRADAEDLAALRKQLAQVAPLRRQVETLTTEAETHTERVGALETVRAGNNPRQTYALDGPHLDCSSPPFALRRIPLWQSLKKARDELASLAKEAAAKTDEAAQAGRRAQEAEAAQKKLRDELAQQKRRCAA